LNFGNPEKPEVMESFARAIDGLAAACKALNVPIVSGNVSLYNETDGKPILPTPTVAAVGLVRDIADVVTQWFKAAGHVVLVLGHNPSFGARALGGSEYFCRHVGKLGGDVPFLDLEAEAKLQKLVLELARARVLASAHDVSDGGLAVAIAECCTTAPADHPEVGARIDLDAGKSSLERIATLFGELPSRVVVSVTRDDLARVLAAAKTHGVPVQELGVTGGDSLSIALVDRDGDATQAFVWPTRELRAARESCLAAIVGE
jgi:phosphoribosylformylglycinamidine synthase